MTLFDMYIYIWAYTRRLTRVFYVHAKFRKIVNIKIQRAAAVAEAGWRVDFTGVIIISDSEATINHRVRKTFLSDRSIIINGRDAT